jgi:hypothetical protein
LFLPESFIIRGRRWRKWFSIDDVDHPVSDWDPKVTDAGLVQDLQVAATVELVPVSEEKKKTFFNSIFSFIENTCDGKSVMKKLKSKNNEG